MNTVQLSETTYRLLKFRANQQERTPDQVAEEILRQQLDPAHPHVSLFPNAVGELQARITGTRIPVSILVGYIQMGETPETVVEKILPHLTLAQVYDALSYYYDHQEQIDRELAQNSEEEIRRYLHEQLGEENYRTLTGG